MRTDDVSAYRNVPVAITGASGYIGSAIAARLANVGADLLLVSRKEPSPAAGARVLVADITVPEPWDDIVRFAEVIIHLAGNTSVYAAAGDPAASLASTVLPVVHLTHAASRAGRVPRVVHASTATVYGVPERLPVSEDTPARPATVYDLHKWFAEQQLALASRRRQLLGASLRLANVYGPSAGRDRAADRGILDRMIAAALDGSTLRVYGGGGYVRDYIYIDDVVRAFLAAGANMSTASSGQSYNVASGVGVTIRDAFQAVADAAAVATGTRPRLENVPWPEGADPIELRNFVADVRRMADVFGWFPSLSLAEGIGRTIAARRRAAGTV